MKLTKRVNHHWVNEKNIGFHLSHKIIVHYYERLLLPLIIYYEIK